PPDGVGKRSPLPALPIYDLFGNVAELMGNPFTMDNGYGSVGGAVIRGGDYTTPVSRLRYSYREELPLFYFRSSDSRFVKTRSKQLGIRLMVGAPIKDFADRGAS